MHTLQRVGFVALCGLASPVAQATHPTHPTVSEGTLRCPPSGQPQTIVVSGGISMGAYQAGQLWVLLEYIQRCNLAGGLSSPTWQDYPLVIVGTSAGAVNTTLVAAELLTLPTTAPDAKERPEESVLYRSWAGVGFGQGEDALDYRPLDRGATALLSRAGSDRALTVLLDELVVGERYPGEVVLGVTTSLVSPVTRDPLKPQVGVQFAVKFSEGEQGVGKALRDQEVVWQRDRKRVLRGAFAARPSDGAETECAAPVGSAESDDGPMTLTWTFNGRERSPDSPPEAWGQYTAYHEEVRFPCLYRASSAIPVVFPIETYQADSFWKHAYQRNNDGSTSLDESRLPTPTAGLSLTETVTPALVSTVDGGVLDNNPRQLAWNLLDASGWGSRDGEGPGLWNLHTYTEPGWSRVHSGVPGMDLSAFFGALLPAARGKDLSERPGTDNQAAEWTVLGPSTEFPPVASHLMNFMGFMDRSFRLWDFRQGMYAAQTSLAKTTTKLTPEVQVAGVDSWILPASPLHREFKSSTTRASKAFAEAADCTPDPRWIPAVTDLTWDNKDDTGVDEQARACAATRLDLNFRAIEAAVQREAEASSAGFEGKLAANPRPEQPVAPANPMPAAAMDTEPPPPPPPPEPQAQPLPSASRSYSVSGSPKAYTFDKIEDAHSTTEHNNRSEHDTDRFLAQLAEQGFRAHDLRALPRSRDPETKALDRRIGPLARPEATSDLIRARLGWIITGLERSGDGKNARQHGVLDTLSLVELEPVHADGEPPSRGDRALIEDIAGVQRWGQMQSLVRPVKAATLTNGRRIGVAVGAPTVETAPFAVEESVVESTDGVMAGLRGGLETPLTVTLRLTAFDRTRAHGVFMGAGIGAGKYVLSRPWEGTTGHLDLRLGYDFARGAASQRVIGPEAGPLKFWGWRYWQLGLFATPGYVVGGEGLLQDCTQGLLCATRRSLSGWGMKTGLEVSFLPIVHAVGMSLRWSVPPHAFSEWGNSFDPALHGGGMPGTFSVLLTGDLNFDRTPRSGLPPYSGLPVPKAKENAKER